MNEEQLQKENEREETGLLLEESRAKVGRRNPPARNTSRFWFERFLTIIQRQNPAVIDSSFLSQIAPSNEGKLLAQLKFLHVIDDAGYPTELLRTLNMVGDEQKKGFEEVIRASYSDLMGEVKIDRALPDDAINFFIRKYAFSREKAVHATRFFLYLAEKASIPISPELSSLQNERTNGGGVQKSQNGFAAVREAKSPSVSRSLLARKMRPVHGSGQILQANITIHLDKDTPKEYWDRVLALLGEEAPQTNHDDSLNEPA